MPRMDKRVFTTEEAAAELGVSSARVRQLILDGMLKTERFGRAHVITAEALDVARQRHDRPGPRPKAEAGGKAVAKRGAKKGGRK
jgi:excisionase family DNA binding protein